MSDEELGCLGCLGCFGVTVLYIALYVAIGAAFGWVIEWAWNLLVPTLLHGPHISYAVACAIFFVISLFIAVFRSPQG